jgi:hypothetical protein
MAASPDWQRQQDAFVQFLIRNVVLGAGTDIGIATLTYSLTRSDFLRSSVVSPIRSPRHSDSFGTHFSLLFGVDTTFAGTTGLSDADFHSEPANAASKLQVVRAQSGH